MDVWLKIQLSLATQVGARHHAAPSQILCCKGITNSDSISSHSFLVLGFCLAILKCINQFFLNESPCWNWLDPHSVIKVKTSVAVTLP